MTIKKPFSVFFFACLFSVSVVAKVVTLDCTYTNSDKTKYWPVRISIDTDNKMANATDDKNSLSGKLSSDGTAYWFTTAIPDVFVYTYRINRQDLSLALAASYGGMAIKPLEGQCKLVELEQPKI